MKARLILYLVILPILLLGNGALVEHYHFAEPLDLHWLATHCTALPEAERAALPEQVELDHEIFDVDYFYTPAVGRGFRATRYGPSKALCFAGIGCLTAPVVEGVCLKS